MSPKFTSNNMSLRALHTTQFKYQIKIHKSFIYKPILHFTSIKNEIYINLTLHYT